MSKEMQRLKNCSLKQSEGVARNILVFPFSAHLPVLPLFRPTVSRAGEEVGMGLGAADER